MSIILKGIDLPEDCIAVEFKYYIPKFNEYTIYDQAVTVIFTAEALNNIIQIPKDHGRIGDLDKLQNAIKADIMGGLNYKFFIRSAPVILEVEGEK